MPVLFQDVNRDTALLLNHAGWDVLVPAGQTCCGALHEHDGDLRMARELAARNVAALSVPGVDALVMNSAGCGAAIKGYEHLIGDAGGSLAARAVDVCRFLLDHGGRLAFRAARERVTYDAPCH